MIRAPAVVRSVMGSPLLHLTPVILRSGPHIATLAIRERIKKGNYMAQNNVQIFINRGILGDEGGDDERTSVVSPTEIDSGTFDVLAFVSK